MALSQISITQRYSVPKTYCFGQATFEVHFIFNIAAMAKCGLYGASTPEVADTLGSMYWDPLLFQKIGGGVDVTRKRTWGVFKALPANTGDFNYYVAKGFGRQLNNNTTVENSTPKLGWRSLKWYAQDPFPDEVDPIPGDTTVIPGGPTVIMTNYPQYLIL